MIPFLSFSVTQYTLYVHSCNQKHQIVAFTFLYILPEASWEKMICEFLTSKTLKLLKFA